MKTTISAFPVKTGTFLPYTRKIPAFAGKALCVLLLISTPALAAPFTYAPDHCDFKITFPEKPFIEEKCTGADKKSCDEVVTYTQMDDASSVNFRITCLKQDPKELQAYTPENLKTTLDEMVKEAGLHAFAQDSALTKNGTRTSVELATGKRNDRDVIYTGQIWIGKTSILSLEGEMLGPQDKKVDEVYSNILKSIKGKGEPDELPAEKPATKTPAKPVKIKP